MNTERFLLLFYSQQKSPESQEQQKKDVIYKMVVILNSFEGFNTSFIQHIQGGTCIIKHLWAIQLLAVFITSLGISHSALGLQCLFPTANHSHYFPAAATCSGGGEGICLS